MHVTSSLRKTSAWHEPVFQNGYFIGALTIVGTCALNELNIYYLMNAGCNEFLDLPGSCNTVNICAFFLIKLLLLTLR